MRMRTFALTIAALTACLVSVSCPDSQKDGKGPGTAGGPAKPQQWRFAAERVDRIDAYPNNPYNYAPPEDHHTLGMIGSDIAEKLHAIADNQDPMGPPLIIFSHHDFETLEESSLPDNIRPPDMPAYFMGWSFVDYGWGVVPSESIVMLDGEEVPFEDWLVEYGMYTSDTGRLVLLYHIALTPKTPLSPGPHTFECQLFGLKGIYGDTDGDGVPDPVELKRGSNPRFDDSDDDGLADCFDWFPTNPDSDNDGTVDGQDPDPFGHGFASVPFPCLGYGDSFTLPAYNTNATRTRSDLPAVSLAGFTMIGDRDDRSRLHLWLDGRVPRSEEQAFANPNNWILESSSGNIEVISVEVDEMDVTVTFARPIPQHTDYNLVYRNGSQTLETGKMQD